ncbi:MAG: helix-turn-helix transcriptional regulator [Clostridiales bacterium]|nr:helix-turn-helix transcriptional regulator [Clostridiales bacterium]
MFELGNRIRSLRIQNNLKQYELSKKADISNTYLSDIEVGRTTPSLRTLKRIAESLNTTVAELLDEEII